MLCVSDYCYYAISDLPCAWQYPSSNELHRFWSHVLTGDASAIFRI